MCGIVAYKGEKKPKNIILQGLKRLEYRGYDSAGIAVLENGKIHGTKAVGKIENLEKRIGSKKYNSNLGIGHTRWATHGEPSQVNSHPHFDCNKKISLVHNGIIENYKELKEKLEKRGHEFVSQTDTEVLAHLIEDYYKGDLRAAVEAALPQVIGTYGICVISSDEPETMIGARKGSPLILGIGSKNEYFIASDVAAILAYTKRVIYLEDEEIAVVSGDNVEVTDLKRNQKIKKVDQIQWDLESIEKNGFDHFMLKEIFEQPEALNNTLRGRITKKGDVHLGGLNIDDDTLRKLERVTIIGCGTSWHAGLVAEYLFEELANIPCEVEYASEFRYRNPVIDEKTLTVVISQSGETADTLAALREAKKKGSKTIGIVNVVGSTIAREVDGGIYTHAGIEIGVASTKAFTTQVAALILLSVYLARLKGMSLVESKKILGELKNLSKKIELLLGQKEKLKKISNTFAAFDNFLYLGRWVNFPIALEGALKLKEISYIHAEGYPSAEMKHGPIALIDKKTPTVFVIPKDAMYDKSISNLEEIKARGGKVIAIATKGDKQIEKMADEVIFVPESLEILNPLLVNVPLQLIAYYIARKRDCDVDKPRNLAKSVTVE